MKAKVFSLTALAAAIAAFVGISIQDARHNSTAGKTVSPPETVMTAPQAEKPAE
jgi:hypothetical protein